MRKIAAITFQSLDGVMQGPADVEEDRSNNFDLGGWAQPWWGTVMDDVRATAMKKHYDLLLGRKTYELFAPYWSENSDSSVESQRMNDGHKYVVSKNKLSTEWKNSTRITMESAEDIRSLKETEGPLIQIHGSWELIQLLNRHNLVDEYRVWTFPIILGTGKRLFSEQKEPIKLTSISIRILSSGVFRSFYKVNR